jgi:hypothetical protein
MLATVWRHVRVSEHSGIWLALGGDPLPGGIQGGQGTLWSRELGATKPSMQPVMDTFLQAHAPLRAKSTGLDVEQQHFVVQGFDPGEQGAFDPEKVGSGWHVSVVKVVIARSSHCATVNVQHSLESRPFCHSDFIRANSNRILLSYSRSGSANSW